jgi:hypothetical protein
MLHLTYPYFFVLHNNNNLLALPGQVAKLFFTPLVNCAFFFLNRYFYNVTAFTITEKS